MNKNKLLEQHTFHKTLEILRASAPYDIAQSTTAWASVRNGRIGQCNGPWNTLMGRADCYGVRLNTLIDLVPELCAVSASAGRFPRGFGPLRTTTKSGPDVLITGHRHGEDGAWWCMAQDAELVAAALGLAYSAAPSLPGARNGVAGPAPNGHRSSLPRIAR